MYAQTTYKQFVGNSHLGINEVGCFLVSDSNLLQKIGVNVDPPTLNNFYESHNLYTYDLTDKANDDITWSTVTKYCPQLVVSQIGGAGFPNSDLAEVEFRYTDHAGGVVTHFCCVNSAADRSIIDSWDGKVKTPAEYEHVYGQPIAWATFIYHTPETTPPGPAAAPVSAPAAVVTSAHPAPAPAPTAPKQLYLPPSVWIWHVYKPGGPWTLPHAIGALDPKKFNGLTYDILGNPAPHIYLIRTQDFGEVAIYAGPDTVAQFPGTGHGEGEDSANSSDTQSGGVPVSEVVPAPVTAPAEPATPASPAIAYTRFDEPMQLVTKEGAQLINFVSGTVVDNLAANTPFEAVGKAVLPNNDTYYMDSNSFGTADQTGTTPITVGIKVTLLQLAEQTPDTPTTSMPATFPNTIISNTPANQKPAEPEYDLPWQHTFQLFMNPVMYVAKEDVAIYDFANGKDEMLVKKGTPVRVGGKFQYGAIYYRAQSSIDKGTWYGFPVTSLVKQNAYNTPFNTNDDIDKLGYEAETLSAAKKHAITAAASADGILARLKVKRGNQ